MKGNKLKTKIMGLIISFIIAVILSSIISTMLHLIFTKVPEDILNLEDFDMCVVVILDKN